MLFSTCIFELVSEITFFYISEPYDFYSWILILIFSVHATGASIFIFEWLSPSGLAQGKTSTAGTLIVRMYSETSSMTTFVITAKFVITSN